jgi:hypothetical protein
MTVDAKHAVEDVDSWELFLSTQRTSHAKPSSSFPSSSSHHHRSSSRRLGNHRHDGSSSSKKTTIVSAEDLEREKERQFEQTKRTQQLAEASLRAQELKDHEKTLQELWSSPNMASLGLRESAVHGLMIDAGSTGSRLHVFEWSPRILYTSQEVEDAVSGSKLSFPDSNSRWTDRLRPGIASFAYMQDDTELRDAIGDYLRPLLDFAIAVLHAKSSEFANYPIFLRATAGMRILEAPDRARVMSAVRDLFNNKTYCPFRFEDEQARVLSGEEEAIYDWAGVNFLLGDLLEQSEGHGTVVNPRHTHGALDLGGASTQVSFYEPHEDVMANLFKFQVGQAKHWNVYAHSFLYYGMNEAINRFQARLAADKTTRERLVTGVFNPCLPGGAQMEIRTNIHLDEQGQETWGYLAGSYPSDDGSYQAVLKNDGPAGDFDLCMNLTQGLLHLEKNSWCQFAHRGDCSLAGIYQPRLPPGDEFVAFSNYYHVFKFLKLPERATLAELHDATQRVCGMSRDELVDFNQGKGGVLDEELDSYCFRSVYVFQLLHNGYGFQLNDTIRAAKVINGHKVGWALGAMLYEINAMPWSYKTSHPFSVELSNNDGILPWSPPVLFLGSMALSIFALLLWVLGRGQRWNSKIDEYEPIKESQMANERSRLLLTT